MNAPPPYAEPDWNDADSVRRSLDALRRASDEAAAMEAHDSVLWAVGHGDIGTYYPVVLAALPELARVLESASPWGQRAAIETLIDLGGSFIPHQGHEHVDGRCVKTAVRQHLCGLRPVVQAVAAQGSEVSALAVELLDLIDDLSEMAAH